MSPRLSACQNVAGSMRRTMSSPLPCGICTPSTSSGESRETLMMWRLTPSSLAACSTDVDLPHPGGPTRCGIGERTPASMHVV